MASSSSSPSSSSISPWKYDVFLSFRGKDVRTNFLDHLDEALRRGGIVVFKDDSELEQGRPISDILTAIEESRFSLIVFSKNYASSPWCLEELVKIYECCCKEGARRQTAFPIFYRVSSSEVQEQTGRYREAFLKHERDFEDKIDQVHRWRKAMTELANFSGWELKKDRGEVDFIREVVAHVHRKVSKSDIFSSIDDGDYIGMDSHLENLSPFLNSFAGSNDSKLRKSDLFSSIDDGDYIGMDSYLEVSSPFLNSFAGSNDVGFVGICGMGGVGKSTLARFIYCKLSCEFDGSSFLGNIGVVHKKKGDLADLQRQLLMDVLGTDKIHFGSDYKEVSPIKRRLSGRRVLVILDDVDQLNQLEQLAGESDWFGSGSRIIITTRDEAVLKRHRVNSVIYRMEELDEDKALKLFSWRAFGDYTPAEGYEELSREFITYASRLPLALKVLATDMRGRSKSEWKGALDKLKKFPDKDILKNLRISFDSLDKAGKEMFLDIACFFIGEDVNFLERVFESCEFFPEIGIRDLIDKSLITILGSKVWMHDLLQQLGQEIVREEHREPGCRSRIWLYEDLRHILSNDTGSGQLEGIVLNINSQEAHRTMSSKSFLKMKKLRVLRFPNLHCLQGQEYLFNELRYLGGNGYPFESLPSGFHPDKLVELHLSHSSIKQLWKGKQPPLPMLKVINLSHSQNLVKTPDFSEIPNLEELILEGCTRLHEVHQSIGVLGRLVLLNLKDCKSLKELPSTICDLKSLKNLILHGCTELRKLPERLGDLTCLEVLDLGRDVANEQPPTRPWVSLSRPWQFFPWQDPSPAALTLPSLSPLRSLRDLNLSYCKLREGAIPNHLDCFPLLESLNLSGNDFESLPTSIGQLPELVIISLVDCKLLEIIPRSINGLSNLGSLLLSNCSRLKSLPDLPTSIERVYLDGCSSLETLPNNTSVLSQLCTLQMDDCQGLRTLPDLSGSSRSGFVDLTFRNCSEFIEKQDVIRWLKGHLHLIVKNKRQGLPPPTLLNVLMPPSRGGIPGTGWFNYVSDGGSLKVELPPYWFNNECLGFSFCVLGFHDSEAKFCRFVVTLNALGPTENPFCVILDRENWAEKAVTSHNSDMVSLHFVPLDKSISANWWNSLSQLEVSIPDDATIKAKCIGLKIMYEQDVEELSGWSGTSSSPPLSEFVSTRSHDDSCSCDSQVETRPSSRRWTCWLLDCLDFVTGIGRECTNCLLPPSPREEEWHGDS